MSEDKRFGLTPKEKASLLVRLSQQRAAAKTEPARPAPAIEPMADLVDPELRREMDMIRSAGQLLSVSDPFFRVHEGIAGAETRIGNRWLVNFSSYNYVGLNGDPRVSDAAKAAIDRYGTSASASRIVSGERPVQRDLEKALAEIHGTEDCVALVSGHATNVTVIGHLFGPKDLILHDALIHNSVVQGAILSGARRVSFPHNDFEAASRILGEQRAGHRHAVIIIEGHYSMDGDVPDLPGFVAVAQKHRARIMVDEAHALGVVGPRGYGLAEHFGIDPAAVDIWMGTLSKALAGCGGYIAGSKALVEYLKFTAPGFVYSVGMSPPVAAASLASLEILRAEPERVQRLNTNAKRFLDRAKAKGLDVGASAGLAIVPIITGSSIVAGRLAEAMYRRDINVQPILYPAVPERSSRLRFFLSSAHTNEQIDNTIDALAEESAAISATKVDLPSLMKKLGANGTKPV